MPGIRAVQQAAPSPNEGVSLALAAGVLPEGIAGAPYPGYDFSQHLSVTGGSAPSVHWSASGALPAGLSLSPQGVLSGTPGAAVASMSFTVQASAGQASAQQQYTISIIDP